MRDFQSIEITNFRGPWTALEDSDVPMEGARFAQNVEYQPGAVKSRYGFGEFYNANEPISAMFNWVKSPDFVSTAGNYLFYINPTTTTAKVLPNLGTPSPYTLFTQANMATATFASGGTRAYIAPIKSDGQSAGQARVIGIYGSALNIDVAFKGQVAATVTPTLSGTTDLCTAGIHRVGFILLTRNGFFGPITNVTDVTVAAGEKITLTITPTTVWPTEASQVWAVYTTVKNKNRWYLVPGGNFSVPAGFAFTAVLTVNVSDADLEAVGTDVSENLNLWSAAVDGTGPFNPTVVMEINNRIGYIHEYQGVSQIAISEPEKPQHITLDQHVLTLPGQRQMVTGFMMPNGLYLTGPNWTYYTSDNGDKPVLWPSMTLVDGAIGTPSPRGVAPNPSQGYAWVASTGGLYLFQGGSYPDTPASDYVSDWWNRINWNAAGEVEVKDQPHDQRVHVKVPLDDATKANYIFTFDYKQGSDPAVIAFSVQSISGVTNIGAIEVVKNPTTKRMELWASNAVAGKIYRQKNEDDTSPKTDDGTAVDAIYETSLLPPKMNAGALKTFHGAHFRVKGSGDMSVTAYGLDRAKSITANPISLSTAPGQEPLRQWYLMSEAQSIRVSGGDWMLSVLKAYWKPYGPRR